MLTGSQLVKKFTTFYGTPKVHYRIHKCPQPIPILSPDRSSPCTHIPLPEDPSQYYLPSTPGSSKWSLSLKFPHQNPVYAFPLPHTCYMARKFHFLDFITRTIFGKQYRSLSSSLRTFLHSAVTSSLLGPNILLSTLSLRYSLSANDQVPHPYKTIGRTIILYILIFVCLDSKD